MASAFTTLMALLKLLQENLKAALADRMTGLHLTQTLPEKKEDLPAIVISFGDVHEKFPGIGSLVKVKQEPEQILKAIRTRQMTGEMIFEVWVNKTDADVQSKIDQASGVLSDLLEDPEHTFRSQGLLKLELTTLGYITSSANAAVWLLKDTLALGRKMVYNFVFEHQGEEKPTEGIIQHVQINMLMKNEAAEETPTQGIIQPAHIDVHIDTELANNPG